MKKKKYIAVAVLIMAVTILMYFLLLKPELKSGYYYGESATSYVEINSPNYIVFTPNALQSTAYVGTSYTITGNILTLKSDDGTVMFMMWDDKLIYIKGMGDLVKFGTVYEWENHMPYE